MELLKLLVQLEYQLLKGTVDVVIRSIAMNSKEVEAGDVFVCIAGAVTNGHAYIEEAIARGAAAIVIDEKRIDECRMPCRGKEITVISVSDTRYALALMANEFYDHPAQKLQIIGITGTKGKTTITYMVKAILEEAGHKVGLIGTIHNEIGDMTLPAKHTTPDPLQLHTLFRRMLDAGCEYVVMEEIGRAHV